MHGTRVVRSDNATEPYLGAARPAADLGEARTPRAGVRGDVELKDDADAPLAPGVITSEESTLLYSLSYNPLYSPPHNKRR
jgi:hypothetical protein